MLTADQAREAVARCWGSALEALPDDAWERPTRCTGWSLLDLTRHAAWGTSMEADALRRSRLGEAGSGIGTEPTGGRAEVEPAVRASVAALVSELDRAAELGDAVEIPFGAVPSPFALQVFTMEAGVHADDVLAAMGRDEPLGPDVVAATSVVLAAVLPVLAAEVPAEGTVVGLTGPTVDLRFGVVDGAWQAVDAAPTVSVRGSSDTAVLRFVLGRTGADDPALEVDEGARAFKAWFPGP